MASLVDAMTHGLMRRPTRKGGDRVGAKIRILRHEGTPQKQAVAMALSMQRAGRLGPQGEYRRVGRA